MPYNAFGEYFKPTNHHLANVTARFMQIIMHFNSAYLETACH